MENNWKTMVLVLAVFAISISLAKSYVEGDYATPVATSGVPDSMCTDEVKTVSVYMANNGTTTWTSGYALVSLNTSWGVDSVPVDRDYMPWQVAGFTFPITAPSNAGNFYFQWMMKNSVGSFFGVSTPVYPISVVSCTPTPTPTMTPTPTATPTATPTPTPTLTPTPTPTSTPAPVCGNHICEPGENRIKCPQDCKRR